MSIIWKPRPPSFPSDERIPYTAAEVNEFEDLQDLHINDGERKQSEDDIELDSKSKLFRARDSVYVRQKQRNSVIDTSFANSDEDNSDSHSDRNVRFKTNYLPQNTGVDNKAFDSEEEVVLRRKTVSSDNSFNANNEFNMESFGQQSNE